MPDSAADVCRRTGGMAVNVLAEAFIRYIHLSQACQDLVRTLVEMFCDVLLQFPNQCLRLRRFRTVTRLHAGREFAENRIHAVQKVLLAILGAVLALFGVFRIGCSLTPSGLGLGLILFQFLILKF